MTQVCCNPYSLLPTELVIQLIGNLNNLRATFFHKIIPVQEGDPKLYATWRIRDNYVDYIIVEIPYAGKPPYNKLRSEDIRFFSVNYADDGTLIQSLLMDNIVEIPISVIRTYVVATFRSIHYNLTFNLYQFGSPADQKESICHLFAFPKFSFVLYGSILINFTLIDYFPIITYVGVLNPSVNLVESYFTYDYANGSIIGTINSQLLFFWNTRSFSLINYYPELKGVEYTIASQPPRIPIDVIIGGQNVYSVEQRIRNPRDPNDFEIIRKGTKARYGSYLGNEPSGGVLIYTSLKEFILIDSPFIEKGISLYIIAFTTIKEGLNDFPKYAVIGYSEFLNTQTQIRTYPLTVFFTDEKDDTFQQYESIFFKYFPTELIVYRPEFERWRTLNKASTALNDVNMSLLKSTTASDVFNAKLNGDNAIINDPSKKKGITYDKRFGPNPTDF